MSVVTGASLAPYRGWVVVATVVACAVVVAGLRTDDDQVSRRVRSRLLHGVPWGTLLTAAAVLAVYLFLQGGWSNPRRPLVVPFRSWSFFYPLGMLTAPFTHGSLGHVTNNLIGTLVFAPVVEYAWGHYPRRRGVQTFTSLRTNPYARVLAVPVATVFVGVFSAVFALGPVIGFSGVVFAYAGFALVTRPVLTVFALVAARVVNLVVSAVQSPEVHAVARPRVVTPWWSDVAVQGHAVGIFAGLLLGAALARSRDEWPTPGRLWFAVLVFAVTEGMWAVYVPLGGGEFRLFRWVGTSVVFVLATVLVLAFARSDRPVIPGAPVGRRRAAGAVLVTVLVLVSVPAVFYNVAPIDRQPAPENAVEVRDYAVGYAEDVEHGYAAAVTVPYAEESTRINASGVVVTSAERYVWIEHTTAAALQNRGRVTVTVGGVNWRRDVVVNRTGWRVAGNDSVYKVHLRPAGEARTLAFTSDPSTAGPVVAGRNVTLRPTEGAYEFLVTRDGEAVGTAPVPPNGSATSAGGLTFEREESRVFAVRDETRVAIAAREEN